jgi:hypothetical protein
VAATQGLSLLAALATVVVAGRAAAIAVAMVEAVVVETEDIYTEHDFEAEDDRLRHYVVKHAADGMFYHASRNWRRHDALVVEWVKDRHDATAFNFKDAHQIKEGERQFDEAMFSIFLVDAD